MWSKLTVVLALLAAASVHLTSGQDAEVIMDDYGNPQAEALYMPPPAEIIPGDFQGPVVEEDALVRRRRQISYPNLGEQQQQQYQQQYQQQLQPAAQQSGGGVGSMLSSLIELGPQLERAQRSVQMFSSLLNPNPSPNPLQGFANMQQQQPAPPPPQNSLGTILNGLSGLNSLSQLGQPAGQTASQGPGQLLSSLSEMVRSTQNSASQGLQSAGQQSAQAAQSAQTGITAALTEIGTGLQRIATNNPSLVPDVKNLYNSVSSKLSSASSSVQQATGAGPAYVPATGAEQLADNLGKAVLQGMQTPSR